jgi:hypothetical protein
VARANERLEGLLRHLPARRQSDDPLERKDLSQSRDEFHALCLAEPISKDASRLFVAAMRT